MCSSHPWLYYNRSAELSRVKAQETAAWPTALHSGGERVSPGTESSDYTQHKGRPVSARAPSHYTKVLCSVVCEGEERKETNARIATFNYATYTCRDGELHSRGSVYALAH
ncbi:hypothetical protein QQF64_024351 [Cirrhinus molitorella]|uniref:Uncharacterized protein n=1 Tax=Cirrhinus molitorella TaxID=172907 RepID=A0ABR3NL05_9TELE